MLAYYAKICANVLPRNVYNVYVTFHAVYTECVTFNMYVDVICRYILEYYTSAYTLMLKYFNNFPFEQPVEFIKYV